MKSINIILQKIISQTIAYIKNFMYFCNVKKNKLKQLGGKTIWQQNKARNFYKLSETQKNVQ